MFSLWFRDIIAASDPTSGVGLIELVSKASGYTLMVVILWGAVQEWWVPGRTHRRIVRERDELLKLAINTIHLGDRTVRIVEENRAEDRRSGLLSETADLLGRETGKDK